MVNKIFCDGGSRGNPGNAACAFVAYMDNEQAYKEGKFLGQTTNNVAEYSGVILALEWLNKQEKNQDQIVFYLDSKLIVNQLKGVYRIKERTLLELAMQVKSLQRTLGVNLQFVHIPREQNKEADLLVNQTLDLQK